MGKQTPELHLPAINEKAVLVNLKIGVYSGTITDRALGEEIAKAKGARHGVAEVRKVIIPKVALSAINNRRNIAKAYHLANTLPWGDNGDRILPTALWFEYMNEQAANERDFNARVKKFAESWPRYVSEAKQYLGYMWKEDDYLTADRIVERFYFHTSVLPIPSVSDFRVDLGDAEISRVRTAVEETIAIRLEDATHDLWVRLHGAVSKIATRLGETDSRVHETLFTNLVELTNLLSKLNFTDDAKLEEMRQAVEDQLCGADVKAIREDNVKRATMAKTAADLSEAMAGYAA